MTLDELYALKRRDGSAVVRTVVVGKCVAGEDWEDSNRRRSHSSKCNMYEVGHAHHVGGRHEGCICVRYQKHLGTDDRLGATTMHELAHLLSRTGHDERWRRWMRKLGQRIPEQYQHRPRPR